MGRNYLRVTVMMLAFSVGVTAAGVFYFNSNTFEGIPPVTGEPEGVQTGQNTGTELELVFVLDTTGSMGGLLDGARQKVWGIINDVMQKSSKPRVRVGLVAYRDRGDDYVTQITPLTEDLDRVYTTLMDLKAGGGGDNPEDVRRALADGVTKAGWSKTRGGLAQVLFLVGDAPPQNYQNEPDVIATTAAATKQNIVINTIQCGEQADTRSVWQEIARSGQGRFFAIEQDGGVESVETPYNGQLRELGSKIGSTYLAYGAAEKREEMNADMAATESKVASAASNTAVADRSLNKAMNPSAYRGDLLQDIESGKTDIDKVTASELPTDLAKMNEAERRAEVQRRLAERKQIRSEIIELSKQRSAFIEAERKKSGKQKGFDAAVSSALAEQLSARGIN